MIIGHHINKEEGQVIVSVSLLPRKIKKQVVRRDTVEQYLSNKVKVGKCLKDNCVTNDDPPYAGEWIFELDNGKRRVVTSTNEKKPSISKEDTKVDSPKAKTRTKRKSSKTKE